MLDDNLKFTALTIFDSLPEAVKKPEIEHWTDNFHGDEIIFAANGVDAYVDALSMIDGMRLSWTSQYQKIKKRYSFYDIVIPAKPEPEKRRALHRNFISDYLHSINLLKVPADKSSRIVLYQKEFPDFVFDQAYTEDDEQIISNYIRDNKAEIYAGMEQLVMDTLCKMQNQGAIKLMASLLTDLMKADDLTPNQLRMTDAIYDLADLAARNRNRLKGAAA